METPMVSGLWVHYVSLAYIMYHLKSTVRVYYRPLAHSCAHDLKWIHCRLLFSRWEGTLIYYRPVLCWRHYSNSSIVGTVRNIGVMFDNTMSMKNQVTSLCKAAHFHLRNIGRIRKSITYEACEKLIHALITSRLDYCNATLYRVTDGQHQRLQKMFNIAARILTLTPPSEDIETVLLETLHWLPAEQRIQ